MTPQDFIESRLAHLKAPPKLPETGALEERIFAALMSKKFRKFSIPIENQQVIRAALAKNIAAKEPIAITWPFGGYKLWRLDEAPEADWAELFTMMYLVRWLAPVCALYPCGVSLTFWFDEVVISKMNNIPQVDLDAYRNSFENLLEFLQPRLPTGMRFDTFLERSQHPSTEAFEYALSSAMEELRQEREKDPHVLSDAARRSIEMNVKLTPEQARDPLWREKVDLMHYGYYRLQERTNAVRPAYTSANITAFATFFEPNVIPIGTTKTSIAKFWVGVGALEQRGDSYIETVLSPAQLEKASAHWEGVSIGGLHGKNFSRIRVIS